MEALANTIGQLAAHMAQLGNVQSQQAQHHTELAQHHNELVQALQQQAQAQAAQVQAAHVAGQGNAAMTQALKAIKPPSFAGEKDVLELDTWSFQMEKYFATMPAMTEAQKVLVAGLALKGQAATWWRDMDQRPADQQPQTWQAFKDALTSMFMPVGRADIARDRLANVRQREKDSLGAYVQYMRQLFLAIPDIAEGEKLDRFKRGLLPYLQKEVILKKPATLEAAIEIATLHEGLRRSLPRWMGSNFRTQPFRAQQSPHSGPSSQARDDPMELGLVRHENGKKGFPPGPARKGSCYNCGKAGHYSHECPDPRKNTGRKNGQWRPRPKAE
jgi:hypothetical protein